MSADKINELLKTKPFYRIDKPMGTYKLYTPHHNGEIPLEIFEVFQRNGEQYQHFFSANLSHGDEKMVKSKGIGGMWKGLTGNSVDEILEKATKELEDFYNPSKKF